MRSRSEIKQSKYSLKITFSYHTEINSLLQVLSSQNDRLGEKRTVISIKPLPRENGEKLTLLS